ECSDQLGCDNKPEHHARCTEQYAPATERRVRDALKVVLHYCSRHFKADGSHEHEYRDEARPVVDAAKGAREGPAARMPVSHVSQHERDARPELQQRAATQAPAMQGKER